MQDPTDCMDVEPLVVVLMDHGSVETNQNRLTEAQAARFEERLGRISTQEEEEEPRIQGCNYTSSTYYYYYYY